MILSNAGGALVRELTRTRGAPILGRFSEGYSSLC